MINSIVLPKVFRPFECKSLIRLGKQNDGGYLVNSHDVDKSDILISFGIRDDWSFEKDFSKINDCELVSFDRESQVPLDDQFYVNHRKMVRSHVDLQDSEDTISIQKILDIRSNKIFLNCDIEGKEYDFFDLLIINSYKFSGICLEVHGMNESSNFFNVINFISKIGLKLVHVHPNNCSILGKMNVPDVLELTFTSSDNILYNPTLTLPHPLDMENCHGHPDYKINFEN
jgi:hypothetical protein